MASWHHRPWWHGCQFSMILLPVVAPASKFGGKTLKKSLILITSGDKTLKKSSVLTTSYRKQENAHYFLISQKVGPLSLISQTFEGGSKQGGRQHFGWKGCCIMSLSQNKKTKVLHVGLATPTHWGNRGNTEDYWISIFCLLYYRWDYEWNLWITFSGLRWKKSTWPGNLHLQRVHFVLALCVRFCTRVKEETVIIHERIFHRVSYGKKGKI